MKIIKIDKKEWAGGLAKLRESFRLVGPVREKEFHNFQALGEDELPDLDFLNTRISAKGILYPQSEDMFEYSLDETREDHHRLKEVEKDYSPLSLIHI